MPEKPSISQYGRDARNGIIVPGQDIDRLRSIVPLIFPGHPNWEEESAERLGLLEPVISTDEMVIVTGRGNPSLAYEIGRRLRTSIDNQPREVFASKESHVVLRDNHREKDTIIVNTTERGSMGTTPNDNIMDTFWMLDAARKASSGKIRLVIPAFAYDRGDKSSESREALPAPLLMQMFMFAGAHSILVMDIHNRATEGAVLPPVNSISGSAVLLPAIQRYLKERHVDLNDVVIVAPDAGAGKRAEHYAGLLGLDKHHIAILTKNRVAANQAEHLDFDGNLHGKVGVIVDDKFDTFGTIVSAATQLQERGVGMMIAAGTHAVFSDKPWEEKTSKVILDSPIEHVIVTDTVVPRYDILANPKVEVVSAAPVFAESIKRIHLGESVSRLIPDPKHPENTDWMCL